MPKRPTKRKDDYERPDDSGRLAGVPGEFEPLSGVDIPVDRRARVVLLPGGRLFAVADAKHVTLYELHGRNRRYEAKRVARHELDGRAQALSVLGPASVVLASSYRHGSRLRVLDRAGCRDLAELPAAVTDLAVAGRDVVVVLDGRQDRAPELAAVDGRTGALRWTRPIAAARVTVTPAPDGRSVVITDATTGVATRVHTGRDCEDPQDHPPRKPDPGGEEPGGNGPHGHEPHRPCGCNGKEKPTHGKGPEHPQPKDPNRPRPGKDDCRPGGPWLPGDCDDWIVQGALLARFPRCQDDPPCKTRLDFAVAKLAFAGSQLLAQNLDGQYFALLDPQTLRTHEVRSLGRGGALLAAARGENLLLTYRWSGAGWGVLPLDAVLGRLGPLDLRPPEGAAESITFYGHNPDGIPPAPAPVVGTRRVLAVPLIEPGQTFSDANLNNFGAFMQPNSFDVVRAYYDEASFGDVDMVTDLFGYNAGPTGTPILLPRTFRSYYFPPFEPGGLQAVEASGMNPYSFAFDGSEALTLHVVPRVRSEDDLIVPFHAIGFTETYNLFPVTLTFGASQTAQLEVTDSQGTVRTLDLSFPNETITIQSSDVAARLADLRTYLESVLSAAESAAGVPGGSPLFSGVEVRRVKKSGNDFGDLNVNFRMNDGPGSAKGRVSIVSQTGLAMIGFDSPLSGQFSLGSASPLDAYLERALREAEADAGYDPNDRLIGGVGVSFAAGSGTVTINITLSDEDGGEGASISVASHSGLNSVGLNDAVSVAGVSDKNNQNALRDSQELVDDVFTGIVARLGGSVPAGFFDPYMTILISFVGAPPAGEWGATDSDAAGLRMFTRFNTAVYAADPSIQLQRAWTGTKLDADPDNATTAHELGHALKLGDLYSAAGFRDDLQYMGGWAMMNSHGNFPHFCGYNKYWLGWIPADRVELVPLPITDGPTFAEALLVPVEHWDSGMESAVRDVFGGTVPVAQLLSINLGGDGVQFDLVEARQSGVMFSQSLPAGPGLIVSNAIDPNDDTRYAELNLYRRKVHLLNTGSDLQNAGDTFDLAAAPELAAVGVSVTVVDVRDVARPYATVKVFHTRVDREQADYVDLAFTETTPNYKSPDIWVDWTGDNPSTDPADHRVYPEGTPLDQGEAVHYPSSGTEPHWVVARVHNRGTADAKNVEVKAYKWDPPGAGDTGNKALFRSGTIDTVPAGGWVTLPLAWDITPAESAHQCIRCEIADWELPEDPVDAIALASDDVWLSNNWAQQNVVDFVAVGGSPYAPIDFRYSVTNDGLFPEIAYLEPEGLPVGMKLTVTPRRRVIQPGKIAIFVCKLELDENVIDAGCKNDREFVLWTYRETNESFERWGACKYKVRPRHRTAVAIDGWWSFADVVSINGQVTPDPGGGRVLVRIAFEGEQPRWQAVVLQAGGAYSIDVQAVGLGPVELVAHFEGSTDFAPAYSPILKVARPKPPA
jgi:hypothetical protein